ncbi:uncharacterized protein EV422DRAFT_101852 [Fimicolochytrium jonesii]|uniref:uncharacterized protein n=1 Tax=Fimicolochytrium jonesii TaxID=1396493 RepID=UPI0022FDD268|nr:uncharacterized protein EV422DRAFT_101852 [Fimicolochytrium jonesii]KAI8819662.1 hypothetical protein EV422DRAFT_101852 [Fimicolochytrium jonesii]
MLSHLTNPHPPPVPPIPLQYTTHAKPHHLHRPLSAPYLIASPPSNVPMQLKPHRRKPVNYENLVVDTNAATGEVARGGYGLETVDSAGYLASNEELSAGAGVAEKEKSRGRSRSRTPSSAPSHPIAPPKRRDSLASTHSRSIFSPPGSHARAPPSPIVKKSGLMSKIATMGEVLRDTWVTDPRPEHLREQRGQLSAESLESLESLGERRSRGSSEVPEAQGVGERERVEKETEKENHDPSMYTYRTKHRAEFERRRRNDLALSAEVSRLEELVAARQSETQDLHAAVELLARRCKALEGQVVGLGEVPVSQTDESLQQNRLNDVALRIVKRSEMNNGIAVANAQSTALMEEIHAKTRQIRRHLKLLIPAREEQEQGAATAAEGVVKCEDGNDGETMGAPPPAPKRLSSVAEEAGVSSVSGMTVVPVPLISVTEGKSDGGREQAEQKSDLETVQETRRPAGESHASSDDIHSSAAPASLEQSEPEHAVVEEPNLPSHSTKAIQDIQTAPSHQPSPPTPETETKLTTPIPSTASNPTLPNPTSSISITDGFADDLLGIMNDYGL